VLEWLVVREEAAAYSELNAGRGSPTLWANLPWSWVLYAISALVKLSCRLRLVNESGESSEVTMELDEKCCTVVKAMKRREFVLVGDSGRESRRKDVRCPRC
jgi:hypothetical protein